MSHASVRAALAGLEIDNHKRVIRLLKRAMAERFADLMPHQRKQVEREIAYRRAELVKLKMKRQLAQAHKGKPCR